MCIFDDDDDGDGDGGGDDDDDIRCGSLGPGPWALGPWARVQRANRPKGPIGPWPRAHRPMAQGQSAQRAPWDPQGRPPGIPRDPPWDPKGPPKITIF